MKQKLLCKCFLSLGLLLLLSVLLPFLSSPKPAEASVIEIGKNEDYRLNLTNTALVKGKTRTLKVINLPESEKANFKSDDPEIASVSDDGIITANKVGTTVITVTIKDESTVTPLKCDVIVGPPAFSVKITKSRIFLALNKDDFLNVILKPSNTVEAARFSSYDTSIVTVSTGGRVSAKKFGLTYVFAQIDATNTDGSNRYSHCTVFAVNTQEEAASLEAYFNDHPELDYVDNEDLNKTLYEFFNSTYDPSASSLVDSLNRCLNDKYDLKKLQKDREADLAKIQSNSLEVISGTTTN